MAEPPKPLNIDDSTKSDETSSPPPFPRVITLDPILQDYISSDLKFWQPITPRHLIESDYEKQSSKPGIIVELPESLNIDSSKSEKESSLQHSIYRRPRRPTSLEIPKASTSGTWHVKYSYRPIIPRHRIKSTYQKSPYFLRKHPLNFDTIAEPPESLNIDDFSESNQESSPSSKSLVIWNPQQECALSRRQLISLQAIIWSHIIFPDKERQSINPGIMAKQHKIMARLNELLNIDYSESDEESSQHTCTSSSSTSVPQPKQKKTFCKFITKHKYLIIFIYLIFLFLIPWYLRLQHLHRYHNCMRNCKLIAIELEKEILDLDITIQALSEYHQQDLPLSKIMALIGDTGVDKSYTVDIIKKKFLRYQNCMRNCNFFAIELEKGILDQDTTIQALTEYLQQDLPLLKIMALIGDTGVDKSYTMDIIKKKFLRRSDNDFSSLYPNFVVLENLRAEHSTDVINYVKSFQEANGNRQINILAVFKVEQIGDASMRNIELNRIINTVKDTFIEANINIKIIRYEPLSENALEKYIINAAKNIGLTLSQDMINYIKRSLIEDNTDNRKA